ncbi:MAG: hypothetical protein ACJAZ9_000668 [Neolewinella sp.]|jgi:hypothetical protein
MRTGSSGRGLRLGLSGSRLFSLLTSPRAAGVRCLAQPAFDASEERMLFYESRVIKPGV